jgi:ABC-type nitrate/sulfonate/bicarbonate transport system substrate-binding protein
LNDLCSRRHVLRAASAFALPLLDACRRPASPAPLRELQIAFVPRITVAGIYLAEEEGFFRDAGLSVMKLTQRKNEYVVPLLTDSKIDVGFVQVNPALVNAIASGARIRIVAGRDVASRTCGSVGTLYGTRKNFPNGLGDLRMLKGKRVAISRTTNLEAFSLDADLASVGMSLADIRLVQMEQGQSVAALVEGRIDATVCNFLESFPEGLSTEIVRGPSMADLYPGMQYNFVAFGPTLLDGDARIGAAFLTAFFRGARAFAAGKYSKNLMETLKRELGQDPQLALKSCRSGSVLDGAIDRPSIQRLVDWAVRKGFSSQPPAISSIIDTRFIEAMKAGVNGVTP